MTNPNTHPAPTMVYGSAPSFDDATAPNPFADIRAGLDAAKRLREHLPGDAPELQQADETIAALEAAIDAAEPAREEPEDDLAYLRMLNRRLRNQVGGVQAELRAAKREHAGLAEENGALQDQISTLRADNDARGVLIEQLRAELDQARDYLVDANRRNEALAAELDTVRSERDAALSERNALRYDVDKLDRFRRDREKYLAAYQRTLRALNAALGEP